MARSRLHQRINRLERLAIGLNLSIKAERRMCQDMEWPDLLALVEATLVESEADPSLMDEILAFVGEAAATPVLDYCGDKNGKPVLDEDGKPVYEQHFFVSWLLGLCVGSWSLPKTLPRRFLEGFAGRHGMVIWRCEDCLCGLGNAVVNRGALYDTCPICSSSNLSHKYLGGPPWDPPWFYRAHEVVYGTKRPLGKTRQRR